MHPRTDQLVTGNTSAFPVYRGHHRPYRAVLQTELVSNLTVGSSVAYRFDVLKLSVCERCHTYNAGIHVEVRVHGALRRLVCADIGSCALRTRSSLEINRWCVASRSSVLTR